MIAPRPSTGPVTAVQRFAAFTDIASGGNPAGVVLDAAGSADDADAMLALAAEVGYSETAFVVDGPVEVGRRNYAVRYFAPRVEVPFCGHATIALAVAIGHRIGVGPIDLTTAAGDLRVDIAQTDGVWQATLVSPEPTHEPMARQDLEELLSCFGWSADVVDPDIPPAVACAGATHAVIALRNERELTQMTYDFDRLQQLCVRHGWVTAHVAWAQAPTLHRVRAPFPYGGVVEDAATGAGAAAYAAYLRDIGILTAPGNLTIRQGVEMGRPSTLYVAFDEEGPVRVTGQAVPIEAEVAR